MIRPAYLRERDYRHNPRLQNKYAQAVAQAYVKESGLPPIQPTPYVKVDPVVARQIAEIFEETPDQSKKPWVKEAYKQLLREVNAQFRMMPIHTQPYGEQDPNPYPGGSAQMMEDVFGNNHLWVYDGGADHAIFTREENWRFRAIHDYYAHAAYGLSFGPNGEENAWVEHAKMFSPLARAAMTTETRGQNSWVNFGPYSDLPVADRPYAEQKAIILPFKYRTRKELREAYAEFPDRFGF